MTNRSKSPLIQVVQTLKLHQPELHYLDNGIPVHEINLGNQQVIKLELIFKAGRWYEKEKLLARATSQLLKAGTLKNNAEQMANFFEYFGASLNINDGFNMVTIQLYCLSKHFETLLPMLQELLLEPAFPQEELQKFIKRNQQNLKVQLQKNDVVAYRLFTEKLFGEHHPYGYNSSDELYTKLNNQKIKSHFEANYIPNNCTIIIAGKTSPKILTLVNQYFGSMPLKEKQAEPTWAESPIYKGNHIHQVTEKDSLQASIRIGRRTFAREHPDCDEFYMMNMVLGGYFGARLMQNLREKNGYTYGVYSSIETLRYDGYWYVHTDVGKDVKDDALTEIYREITRLQDTPLAKEELEMVRNYTLGMQLTSLDGVFNISSIINSLVTSNLNEQFFYTFVNTIKTISAKQIQEMAQKYLKKEDLIEVVIM
jgi:zinc protease